MATVLQILFVLLLIVIIIVFVFQPKRSEALALPENFRDVLNDYVRFYAALHEDGQKTFEDRLQKFLLAVKITGANAQVEDLDRLLIGAAAIIPVYGIPDWEYINLREVLLYPGHTNTDFEQQGRERNVAGMVGTGALQNVMILSKWELRQGFVDEGSHRNTALHEFVHLIDKMDGTVDGVPQLLLPRQYVPRFKTLLEETMDAVRHGRLPLDAYAATSPVECFAVVAEYFFEQPESLRQWQPELYQLLQRIFVRNN